MKKRKPGYLYKEFNCKVSRDHFTLVFCFYRRWCVVPVFRSLNAMKIPLKKCHLLIYDNSDDEILKKMMLEKMELYSGVFASMRYYKSYRQGCRCIRGMENVPFDDTKLAPIQAMYKELPKHIRTKLFISIEDDGYCPPNTIMELLTSFEKYKKKYKKDVYVSGVEPTRSVDKLFKPILGVYWIQEKNGKIIKKTSARADRYTTIRVHACGHYCFITTKKIWKKGWEYPKSRLKNAKHLSIDVFHTYHLHQNGIPVLANFKIRCQHMHPVLDGIIYWKVSQAKPSFDYYVKEFNAWAPYVKMKEEIKLKE